MHLIKKNIVLIDSNETEGCDFIKGLEDSTNKKWVLIVETSNDRRTKLLEYIRYFKYFYMPFKIFLKRNQFETIVAWQQFYGILFAFYSRIFRVRKKNKLVVMSFIYKKKKGIIGKIYDRFMKYVVTSQYVDFFTSVASVQCDDFRKYFKADSSKFQYLPWGITDLFPNYESLKADNVSPYFFCAGRSNRDWSIVFDTFGNTGLPCKFICSDVNYANKYRNIQVLSNVSDEEYFSLSLNSHCVIISIRDCNLAGGEITILNAMQFGKPVILIQDNPYNDYVFNGITGYIVPKDSVKILEVANDMMNNHDLRNKMARNARKYYEENFSIYSVGKNIGNLINKLKEK